MAERLVFGVSAPPERIAPYRARHAAELAAGRHPMTGEALRTDGRTCGQCAHLARVQFARIYLKCDQSQMAWTHGPATDCKARWPACTLFEERERP